MHAGLQAIQEREQEHSQAEIKLFLKALPIFSTLTDRQVDTIANYMETTDVEAGERLHDAESMEENSLLMASSKHKRSSKSGYDTNIIFIILQGHVLITQGTSQKQYNRGDLFGIGAKGPRKVMNKLSEATKDQSNMLLVGEEELSRYQVCMGDKPVKMLSMGLAEFVQLLGPLQLPSQASFMDLENLALICEQVPLLKQLTSEELEQLLPHFKMDRWQANQPIFKEGDSADAWYILLEGRVSVTTKDGQYELRQLTAISMFGERGILWNNPRSSTITSIENCVTISLSADDTKALLPPKVLTLLQTSLPPPGFCDLPPAKTKQQIRMVDLSPVCYLGKGTYGVVQLVRHSPSGRVYALKAMNRKHIEAEEQCVHVHNERDLMMEMDHPFLQKLHCTFKNMKYLYLLTDYLPGGELLAALQKQQRFSEDQTRFFVASFVCMFEYLHHKDIVYRDLKLENVLLDRNGYATLIDFGFAKRLEQGERTYTICGTPAYVAPEVLKKVGHGPEADWWTVGVIMYEMFTGFTPFSEQGSINNARFLFQNICNPYYTIKFPRTLSKAAIGLVTTLLSYDPPMRIGFQVYEGGQFVKSHPWFEGFEWTALLQRQLNAPFLPEIKSVEDVSNFNTSNIKDEIEDINTLPPYKFKQGCCVSQANIPWDVNF